MAKKTGVDEIDPDVVEAVSWVKNDLVDETIDSLAGEGVKVAVLTDNDLKRIRAESGDRTLSLAADDRISDDDFPLEVARTVDALVRQIIRERERTIEDKKKDKADAQKKRRADAKGSTKE